MPSRVPLRIGQVFSYNAVIDGEPWRITTSIVSFCVPIDDTGRKMERCLVELAAMDDAGAPWSDQWDAWCEATKATICEPEWML